MLGRIAVIASLALTAVQPVAAQQEGAAKSVHGIQICMRALGRYFVPDPEHAEQKRAPMGVFDIHFQADPTGVIAFNAVEVISRDAANLPHDRASSRALARCLARVQDGVEPDQPADELQAYVLPVTILSERDRPKPAPIRDYFRSDIEFVIMTLLAVAMPAIGALPFAATNR